MVRSLWTGASGMIGQQSNIDTISNNLANVNTAGYKKMRADFEDLIYQTVKIAGTPATEDTVVPVGIQMGHGVKIADTQRVFTQGAPQNTDEVTDMAIMGEGFFRIQMYDGSWAYTRNGNFKVDETGRLVTSNGYWVLPDIIMPENFLPNSVTVTQDGRVSVIVPQIDDEPIQIGQLELKIDQVAVEKDKALIDAQKKLEAMRKESEKEKPAKTPAPKPRSAATKKSSTTAEAAATIEK